MYFILLLYASSKSMQENVYNNASLLVKFF